MEEILKVNRLLARLASFSLAVGVVGSVSAMSINQILEPVANTDANRAVYLNLDSDSLEQDATVNLTTATFQFYDADATSSTTCGGADITNPGQGSLTAGTLSFPSRVDEAFQLDEGAAKQLAADSISGSVTQVKCILVKTLSGAVDGLLAQNFNNGVSEAAFTVTCSTQSDTCSAASTTPVTITLSPS
jgi:hypothetical protein